MLLANDIVLIDQTRNGVNSRLEVWTRILESKGSRLSGTPKECLYCKFSDETQEVGVEVRLDKQVIPKRRSSKYQRFVFG